MCRENPSGKEKAQYVVELFSWGQNISTKQTEIQGYRSNYCIYTHLALLVATVSPRFGRRAVAPAWPLLQVWGSVWKCRWGSLRPERWQWGKSWGMNRQLGHPPDAAPQASQMFWGSATRRAAWRSSEALGCIRSALASAHAPPGPVSAHFCCDPLRPAASAGLRPGNFWPCSRRRTRQKDEKHNTGTFKSVNREGFSDNALILF